MKLVPVTDSSVITGHGYDMDSRTLVVSFKGGNTYTHEDVPPEKYAALTGAASPGGYYNKKIRNQHPAQKQR